MQRDLCGNACAYHRHAPGVCPSAGTHGERRVRTNGAAANNAANHWEGEMLQLKRNLLSVALASATMLTAHAAHAQSTQAPANADAQDADAQKAKAKKSADESKKLDTVVVTGIRRGIERSIDTKKNSTSIVEAVSAEDI